MIPFLLASPLVLVLAILTAVLGVGRLTRVLVHDPFPPAAWLRARWDDLTDGSGWNKLMHCWWCASQWVSIVAIGHFMLGYYVEWIGWTWWIFWGSLAIGYVAAIIIARDEPEEH